MHFLVQYYNNYLKKTKKMKKIITDNYKMITIKGKKYFITLVEPKTTFILEQHLKFEVYFKDLEDKCWAEANEACQELGDGWRLPTRQELHLIYLNKDDSFHSDYYWSCTQYIENLVYIQCFGNGNQGNYPTWSINHVRPVRSITI